jgi:hypothetical protein
MIATSLRTRLALLVGRRVFAGQQEENSCNIRTQRQQNIKKPRDGPTGRLPFPISSMKTNLTCGSGWYAMDTEGNLVSGPFVSCEKCVERINQATKSPTSSSLP